MSKNNSVLIDGGLTRSTVIKDGLETVTEYLWHSSEDSQSHERKDSNNTKIKNIKEGSVVKIKGYDLKYGSSIEFDDEDDHLIYIYDEDYTVHTEQHGRINTIERDGKMTTTIDQGNGLVSKSEYEKPIKSETHGYGGRFGVSGLEYTVERHYDNNGELNYVISHNEGWEKGTVPNSHFQK